MTKRYAPATNRNREPILAVLQKYLPSTGNIFPILAVLQKYLPSTGNILEIASGTGEHSVFFAPHFFSQKWIPSDVTSECLASINSWGEDCPTDNLQSPLTIDVMKENWYESLISENINALVCINMIHISPWSACVGLLNGAGKILPSGGVLYLYGPYKVNNQHTSIGNEQFDATLRFQNDQWGIRDVGAVKKVAQECGFDLGEKVPMPANNFSLIFNKKSIQEY